METEQAAVDAYCGYQRLWMAVLLDALRLAARPRVWRWQEGADLEARSWVLDGSEAIGSCRWVCQVVGYRHEQALAWMATKQAVPQKRGTDQRAVS